MPTDFSITAIDDSELAKKMLAAGVIRGGETGFVAVPHTIISYIGVAKDPDTAPVIDPITKIDLRPNLSGVYCFIGLDDDLPKSDRDAIDTALASDKFVSVNPLRKRLGSLDVIVKPIRKLQVLP